ncbi:hypothetical protein TNCT_300971 [Trichonephila clavata]|uniref:Uncharacterized protein n=1 Tax=Trichonephila clavata TaxID=2740835 RepID=A0A8X6G0N0_TRICU|nr:hypothetical protein TNCT_300971 [Trichonephila clavata]
MPYHVTEGGGVGCDLDLPRVWLNLLPDPQARSSCSEDSAISNPVTAPVGANSFKTNMCIANLAEFSKRNPRQKKNGTKLAEVQLADGMPNSS